MLKIFLIVSLWMPGSEPTQLENSEQPDLATCMAAAAHIIEQMAAGGKVTDKSGREAAFEFAAGCNVIKSPGNPA